MRLRKTYCTSRADFRAAQLRSSRGALLCVSSIVFMTGAWEGVIEGDVFPWYDSGVKLLLFTTTGTAGSNCENGSYSFSRGEWAGVVIYSRSERDPEVSCED